ncbi:putative nucleotidyltransferase with HDIG domain [Actinoplanes campanulatus]|uniref:Putative nucleotidyltransferase with HDIG domain n=1 Tax=Actinoplanes campanulatus TaxID=113559 RepID=A0A7W5FJ54_9ACTN|nr:HDIG domain-containing metalloprotein [Actinoplanes campanulatus]MBB3100242.1 putative nucleotidyltransferase with HDIG domain [Actinoplanes campanulatus]GGN44249.1 metal-dependent phosphohydrolase, HD subdomain protein [Actinoplanes campanulatus]GID40955.1 metal-dependent phosphohydrolase, HD subdomain protein [Actinoplanes campanulatus]
MTDALRSVGDVHRARNLAQRLLVDLPERWRHTIGVARRAEMAAATVGPRSEGEILLTAAWLHDIGYAATLHDTGFHPIDGAHHLETTGWPSRIVALVAHHSAALYAAQTRGLTEKITRFPREQSRVSDALTYADQTVAPNGRVINLEQRLADMLRRHGPDSPNAAAHQLRTPLLRAAVVRVQHRLAMVDHLPSAA